MPCNCGRHTSAAGGSVIGALFAGVAVLIHTAWWLIRYAVVPLVALLAVFGYRWVTGLPLIHHERTAPPTFTRQVAATGRDLLTAIIIGVLINPLITTMVFASVIAGTGATIATMRLRVTSHRKPRRVRATTGTPTPIRRATIALAPSRSDVTWTEQTVRESGRVA